MFLNTHVKACSLQAKTVILPHATRELAKNIIYLLQICCIIEEQLIFLRVPGGFLILLFVQRNGHLTPKNRPWTHVTSERSGAARVKRWPRSLTSERSSLRRFNLVEESSWNLNAIVFLLVLVLTPYLENNYWRKKQKEWGKKLHKTMKTGWIIIRVKAMPITKMPSYITAVIMIILMPQEKGCRRLLEQQKSLDCRSYVRGKSSIACTLACYNKALPVCSNSQHFPAEHLLFHGLEKTG